MEPASIIIAQFLAEFIAGKFLEDNILAKFKESQIKREIADVIDRTLRDTISDFPDAEYIFNNLEINSYLSDPFVQSEIGKLVQSNDATQPIGDVLKDKWLQYLSSPISGNFQIVVDNFLVRLKRNLWEIKELQELLHLKQQNEVYELIKNYLPSLQHSISEISSNLPSTVEVQDESERAIVQKMEVCRSLLRQGFPTASLAQLRTLESDIQNLPISNQTRSKFYTLLVLQRKVASVKTG